MCYKVGLEREVLNVFSLKILSNTECGWIIPYIYLHANQKFSFITKIRYVTGSFWIPFIKKTEQKIALRPRTKDLQWNWQSNNKNSRRRFPKTSNLTMYIKLIIILIYELRKFFSHKSLEEIYCGHTSEN